MGPNVSCVMTGLQRKEPLQSTLNWYMLLNLSKTKTNKLACVLVLKDQYHQSET